MSLQQTILALETETWEALKKSGNALIPYLAPDTVMIFPAAGIFSKSSDPPLHEILSRPDLKPWTRYELQEVTVLAIGPVGASISYRVTAERDGMDYEALISSIWRNDGAGWKMILHQQTPL